MMMTFAFALAFMDFPNAGDDTVNGGAGIDTIYGQDGGGQKDLMNGDGGDDTLYSGEDVDIFGNYAFGFGASVDAGNDRLYGDNGNDLFSGGDGNDYLKDWLGPSTIFGGARDDFIEGKDQADYLDAGTGNDAVYAGSGADTLVAGGGTDSLLGGAGADWFTLGTADGAFDAPTNLLDASSTTFVVDFQPGIDILDLTGVYANFAAAQADAVTVPGVGISNRRIQPYRTLRSKFC